jgi:hypothetical protein
MQMIRVDETIKARRLRQANKGQQLQRHVFPVPPTHALRQKTKKTVPRSGAGKLLMPEGAKQRNRWREISSRLAAITCRTRGGFAKICRSNSLPTHEPSLLICLLLLKVQSRPAIQLVTILIGLYYPEAALYFTSFFCASQDIVGFFLLLRFIGDAERGALEKAWKHHNDGIIYEMNQCQSEFQTKRFFILQ